MVLAAEFSAHLGLLAPEAVARVTRHLEGAGLPVRPADVEGGVPGADRLMDLMSQDKKVKRGKLTFILLRDIGAAYIAPDVDPALLRAFLAGKLDGK
jgi:3-dehydroquinate synthase